jgi:peptidoglycan/xylan/chitin deacetylase (PgdA/CDA1 family)
MRKHYFLTALTGLSLLSLVGVYALPWHGLTLWERWREARSGRILYAAHTGARVVALTFDDGPDPRYTPRILNILKARHVRATFFVCGRMLGAHPGLARRIVQEGHVLGNHTETHPHLETERNPDIRSELDRCEQRIEAATGERTYLFRPPRGFWNPAVFGDATKEGYDIILWSLAFDHQAIRNPDALRRRVVRLAQPGDIILLHDGSLGASIKRADTVRELDSLIVGLRQRGFRFATVPEMLHVAGNAPISQNIHNIPSPRPSPLMKGRGRKGRVLPSPPHDGGAGGGFSAHSHVL